jgi:hypothetical protein
METGTFKIDSDTEKMKGWRMNYE